MNINIIIDGLRFACEGCACMVDTDDCKGCKVAVALAEASASHNVMANLSHFAGMAQALTIARG